MTTSSASPTLASALTYVPRVLNFGTSGRRGDVVDLSQLEAYINARAELDYLQRQSLDDGGIGAGEDFYYAHDLRPSSTRYVVEQGGRGEIAQAIEQAIRDAGMRPVNLGPIPTPALAAYALGRRKGSKMSSILESGDMEEALNAASAIGDDRLQKQFQGSVVPDSFTHGTSEQRVRWFRKGFETGDTKQGDTFSATSL